MNTTVENQQQGQRTTLHPNTHTQMEQQFIREEIQHDKKAKKTSSNTQVIKEMQTKATMGYFFHLSN